MTLRCDGDRPLVLELRPVSTLWYLGHLLLPSHRTSIEVQAPGVYRCQTRGAPVSDPVHLSVSNGECPRCAAGLPLEGTRPLPSVQERGGSSLWSGKGGCVALCGRCSEAGLAPRPPAAGGKCTLLSVYETSSAGQARGDLGRCSENRGRGESAAPGQAARLWTDASRPPIGEAGTVTVAVPLVVVNTTNDNMLLRKTQQLNRALSRDPITAGGTGAQGQSGNWPLGILKGFHKGRRELCQGAQDCCLLAELAVSAPRPQCACRV